MLGEARTEGGGIEPRCPVTSICSRFLRPLAATSGTPSVRSSIRMSKPIPQVEQGKFEDVVRRLLEQKPTKRTEVKTDPKKPAKIIPPQE